MADPTLFTSVTDNTLLPFGQNLIAQGDDNSERFDISAVFENGFSFGNRIFNELFLSTNGGVSFINQTISFAATLENTNFVIAPFLNDLDNRTLPPGADPGIYFDVNTDRDSVVMTWVGVGIFANDVTAPNTFQLEIMDLGNGDAELIFRFSDMGNSSGNFQLGAVADGGPRVFLRGGTGSDVLGTAADMDTLVGNTGVAGVWQFRTIDGQLQADDLIGDVLTGNANPNAINGTDLNDIISGGGGNDTINGRLGIDRLNGDAGNDRLNGEGDDDILFGGTGDDSLFGGTGDDSLFGDEGNDTLNGEAGINELDGGSGADALVGTGGMSFATYGSSNSGLTVNLGSTGSNTGDAVGDTYTNVTGLIGSNFADDLTGDASANIIRGGAGNDNIDGGAGNDTLFGDEGNDTLVGGDGDDELAGGLGADNLIGGAGSDAASYRDVTTDVVADLANSAANSGAAAGDSYSSIENLIGGSEDDHLSGNASANLISGLDGNDTLVGRAGNDTLEGNNEDDVLNGGEGADALFGGLGIDTAIYVDAVTGVRADLSDSSTNTGEAAGDTYSSIENLVGSAFADTLVGDSGDNQMDGMLGNNRLEGRDGNDTLHSGAGEDSLFGGSGTDTVDYSGSTGGVSASLHDSNSNTGDARGDVYSSIENLVGTEFDDTLEDTSGDNMIMGRGGNDTILLRGGADTIDGGDGTDTVSYQSTGFVVVDLADASQNRGAATGATFTSIENLIGSAAADDLFGDANDNMLVGGGNSDNLFGRDGNDTLDGGAGNDNLSGGSGADVVVMRTGMGADRISDFVVGEDMLDFSSLTPTERAGVTFLANGTGERVVRLSDGSTLTMTGVERNFAATGTVNIDGLARERQTLTADVATVADRDGVGAFSFQWLRGGVEISGATARSYVLTQADVGEEISLRATFVDGFGSTETLTSAATSPVQNVNDPATGAVVITGTANQNATLTADASAVADPDGLGAFSFQWLRGGVEISGATAGSYVLTQADVGQQITVRASFTDGGGSSEARISAPTANVANVNDPASGAVVINGLVREDQILTANTGGVVDPDGVGSPSFQWLRGGVAISGANAATYGLTQADVGQQISVRMFYTDGFGANEQLTSAATAPVVNVNDLPTGTVAVLGSARVGEFLSADTLTLADEDGLGALSLQWLRAGVAISGATTTTYQLTSADVGSAISLRVRYTDSQGTAETVTSAATEAVTTGNLTLNGTPGPDRLVGGSGNDIISGLAGPDVLIGNDGDDILNGGDGADTLNGGSGDDFIFGGSTDADLRDLAFGGDGNDFIDGGYGNDELHGGNGNDTIIGGFGSDTLIGNDGNDVFLGAGGSDIIFGNAGNDFINGGFGFDRLNGGDGADTFFHVGVVDHGSDWIQDYNAAEGDVLLTGIVGATRSQFQVNVTHTTGAGSAGVAEAFVIYRPTGQILFALVDGAGQADINLKIGDQIFDIFG